MKREPLPEGLYCPNLECPVFGQEEGRQLEWHPCLHPLVCNR